MRATTALLIYDGECQLCTTSARRVAAAWQGSAKAVPAQSLSDAERVELGLSVEELASVAWWVTPDGRTYRGHRAIAHALMAARGWRRVCGRLLLLPPFNALAALLYIPISRWRRSLPRSERSVPQSPGSVPGEEIGESGRESLT